MGRARISREQYDEMLVAFREQPGNAAHAARRAGLQDYRSAKRAWTSGWDAPEWAVSIEKTLDDERAEIRARALELEREAQDASLQVRQNRETAKTDAVDQAAREVQASKASMSSALTVLAGLGQLAGPILKLAQRLAKQLDEMEKLDTATAFDILRLYAKVTGSANLAAQRALQIERLRVGDPTSILGTKALTGDPIAASAERAIAALKTEEGIASAARDLFDNNLSPEAMALLESQDFDWDAAS